MGLLDPVITWWDGANAVAKADWQLNTVKAGSAPSLNETTFLIWNNRGGASAKNKAYNCTLTTQDTAGNMTIPLVREKWVQVKCVSMGESGFTEIGADPGAGGTWVAAEKPIKATGSGAASQEILGDINDGLKATAATQNCFSEVTLQVAVPTTATAGNVDFLVRLYYEHV